MKTDKFTLILAALIFAVGVIGGSLLTGDNTLSLGSVSRNSEYHSTTTPNAVADLAVIKEGAGTLGSVVVTRPNTGVLYFYDATTSDITKRNNVPTSTLRLFVLPAGHGSSTTFTLDTVFNDGLLIDIEGTAPTTTITWR